MIKLSDHAASVDEFRALREASGLGAFSVKASTIALANSLHGAWLRDDCGTLIGMGRIIGDGGCFAHVTDIAIKPAFQRQGFGTVIVAELMGWADQNLPKGCYISLIADPGAEKLYEKFGFQMRTGMSRSVA